MGKIMINIPLTKYLKEVTKEWGETYITKTKGGQVWISDDAPGDISSEDTYYISMFTKEEEYIDKNYIEFNDSGMFMRLPKEISKNIIMEPGTYKKLKDVLKEIKIMEENI